jgi:hypothetical protein
MSQSDELQHATAEVPAEVAYQAAVERAGRTQHALILAEAQVTVWKQLYVQEATAAQEARAENDKLKTELEKLQAPCPYPPCRLASAGGDENAAEDSDPAGYAGAGSEADRP